MAVRCSAPLDSAQQEQIQDDNQYHPDDARGTLTVRVIASAAQAAKEEHTIKTINNMRPIVSYLHIKFDATLSGEGLLYNGK
jgi:hypothetical protein